MTHKLFYEGRYMGEVSNPLSSQSHCWLCQRCGRTFAFRQAPPETDPFAGPLRVTFWEKLCSKCLRPIVHQYEFMIPDFRCGGDAVDQLPTLRAQFLYESEIYASV